MSAFWIKTIIWYFIRTLTCFMASNVRKLWNSTHCTHSFVLNRELVVSCWHRGLFTLCFWPFFAWLGLALLTPPQISAFIRLTYLLKASPPLCIMASRFPGQCASSALWGCNWILNTTRLASKLTLHKKARWSHSSLQLKAADSLCYSVASVK